MKSLDVKKLKELDRKELFKEIELYLFKRGGKYAVLGISIAIIHFIYLIYFFKVRCLFMAIYNILSVCGYLYFAYECPLNDKIHNFYFFVIAEVPLHAALATFFLGWNFRFMFILLGVIPSLYYFVMFIDSFKSKLILPTIISIAYTFLYIIVRLTTTNKAPLLPYNRYFSSQNFFTYFNVIISFTATIYFNILNAIEYRYVKNKIADENKTLDTYASFDALTQLYNRRSTNDALEKTFKNHYNDNESFSVIMCDIDKFKLVNDTYGHDCGDYILKEVSSVLKSQVRDTDVVGRWGGEEFLIIVNGDKKSAAALAERIRTQIENHTYTYNKTDIHVTLTLGVSAYHAGNDISTLVTSADKKLYRGKENGRNQVVA